MRHPFSDSVRRLALPPLDRPLRLIVAAITAMAALFAFANLSHADAPGAGRGGALRILLRVSDSNVSFTIDWRE
jgi:hypothetical protein